MNRLYRMILTPIKDLIGLGYSKCKCCGFPWNLVEPHSITVVGSLGCFATCEDCWKNKTDDEIISAYDSLYEKWLSGDNYNKPLKPKEIGFTKDEMLSVLKEKLKLRKEE